MISSKLKKALVISAIQGKLTQQNINTESSEDLLNKINTELSKDKKQFFNGDKDVEVPFEIPENWKWVRLSNICKSIKAGGDKPKDTVNVADQTHFIPVIGNGINNKGIVGYTSIPSINDLSITVSGRGTIGYSFVRKEPYFPIVRLLVIIPSTYINIDYLSMTIETLIETGVGTSIKQLTVPMISNKLIPLPPIEEQKRIVEKLDEILPLIDSLEKDELKLKELMQQFPNNMKVSILQAAIQGKITEQKLIEGDAKNYFKEEIRLNEDYYPFEIPNNWVFVKMKHLVSIQTGKKDANFGALNGKYDFFTCALAPIKADSYSHEGESILLPGNGANVGVAIYYNGKFEAYQRTYILQKMNDYISIKYLYYHLMANWKSFNKEKQYGSAIPYIKMGNLTEYPVAVPPLKEQIEIVKKLEKTIPFIETIDHD